jgi:hypothetical protein
MELCTDIWAFRVREQEEFEGSVGESCKPKSSEDRHTAVTVRRATQKQDRMDVAWNVYPPFGWRDLMYFSQHRFARIEAMAVRNL